MQENESEMISDETMKSLCSKLVPINYLVSFKTKTSKFETLVLHIFVHCSKNIASDARKHREKKIKQLLEKRKIPDNGLDDLTIELLVNEISQLDSNNFITKAGK